MGIVVVVVVLFFLIVGPVVVVNRDLLFNRGAAKRRYAEEPLPFLIIPTSGADETLPARVLQHRNVAPPRRARELDQQAEPQEMSQPVPLQILTPLQTPLQTPPQTPSQSLSIAAAESNLHDPWAEVAAADDDEEDEPAPDATIVFTRPVDEPLQILPGRLRILSGDGAGEDLRLFSRLGEHARIVVGRDTGPAHEHITLRSPTVSRRHARMDFDNGHWTITNLSETNPVLVNDHVLNSRNAATKLSDGDRIELGDVTLRFQAS